MTEHDFMTLTREGYDRTAVAYAERFHDHLDDKPIDLAMITGFAGLIRQGRNTHVLDVGCGTGATTALLATCGVTVTGIDLSPNMIGEAERINPGLQFTVGSMTDLDAADGSAGGVCAWYSIIHVPDEHLAGALSEFYRVLAPNGLLLLAFQVGNEPRVLTNAFGQEVNLTFIRRQPRQVEDQLIEAGFRIYSSLLRQPDNDGFESTPHSYLIAQKCETERSRL
ncbi:class I SAM-dependent methyltransferase [Antrihabitans cavernicola]|uniref:Methyltransferase domain-containing protein n=1 Tax=Antrihabitans cavernicola TaxID=2495913 RepID=A0A5A7SCU8_9NOCA|nr:class I SAM-dependent methyltransferase [Spelaeibacter cavernicola]KAA0022557.1 methyltransferase domain-containing protein [Spelaeibacter cavernicola]